MHRARSCLALLSLAPALVAASAPAPTAAPAKSPAPAAAPAAPPKQDSQWVFSILPKSLQKNPRLELTVITEMTDEGKKLPPVSPDKPAYYETFSLGFHQLGDAPANEHTLKQDDIEKYLIRSLATNGYLRAERPQKPPSLLILYTWGSHNMLTEGDDENPALSGNQIARNILDRAALVGGAKFAKELLELFQEADDQSTAANATVAPSGQPVMTPEMVAFANPVNLFKMRSAKNEFLLDQAASDVYYVVASAYDYASATTDKKILLWRTRMTVAAPGVSQEQSLPTLVLSAAPYFGKDMPEAETLSKRTMREGNVEIGTPTVVETATPEAARPTR
ncbi:MAG TPA: hypothetical protein VHD62_14225 [Opitutaceae bacterium]|nr:hypothetical protein [Opitutaceae bacterium]